MTTLSEVSQSEKDKYHAISHICGIYNTSEHINKTKPESETQRTEVWLPRERREGEELKQKFGIIRCKLVHIGWINNKVLLCSTRNYTQYPAINHNGKEYEK